MTRYYNKTNTCDNCGEKLVKGKTYKKYNKERNWTGEWICKKCYYKVDYSKRPDCSNNIIKALRDFRIGNLDPYSETGKGYIFQQITCETRKIKDLNIIDDNFHSTCDHSKDIELGIIETKGAIYEPIGGIWNFSLHQEKYFDYVIAYCMSLKMNEVERVFIIPRKELIYRSSIWIKKYNFKGWYEKYRVDEKPYNDTYQIIRKNGLPAIKGKW